MAHALLASSQFTLPPQPSPQLQLFMNSDDIPVSSSPDLVPSDRFPGRFCCSLSWGAILAGLTAAIALQVLFMLLGAGLGFAIYSPLTDANPIADFGVGAIIVQGISAVFSLWFGGWVAGRFAPKGVRTGWLHGFLVWCAATVAGVLIVSAGAGWALGDLSKLGCGGLSMAGKPAAVLAESAGSVAKEAAKNSSDTLESFVDEASGNASTGSTPGATIRTKREVGMAVARLFDPAQAANTAANRAALVKVLADHGSMSEADAGKTITQWTESYDHLQADLAVIKHEAEQKARVAAAKAAKALAIFSLCTFVAFVLGGLAASCGGSHGACHARKLEGAATVGL